MSQAVQLPIGADWKFIFTPAAGVDLTGCASWLITVTAKSPDGSVVVSGCTTPVGGQLTVTAPDSVTGIFKMVNPAATTAGYAGRNLAGTWGIDAWRDDSGFKAPLVEGTFQVAGTVRYPA